MAITQGAYHIGLTVPDLTATRDFFVDVFEFKQIGEVPNGPAYSLSDNALLLTLWQACDPVRAMPFDRQYNIGLHHFTLRVDGLDTLNALHEILKKTAEVKVEYPPKPLGDGPDHHMMFSIPGGICMELVASDH